MEIAAIHLADYEAVYVDIAKVASSSLKAVFATVLGLDLAGVDGNPPRAAVPLAGAA